jgi:6-phosphogluconolactonase
MSRFDLTSFSNAAELAAHAAGLWLDEIAATNRAGKPHYVALSGGRITQKFFESVVEQNRTRKISFAEVHFFWADERCVPPAHPDSNFKMADELLFQPLKIAVGQIHRLRGELPVDVATKTANEEIRQLFLVPLMDSLRKLDLILLGMGEDGHVASLFPNARSIDWDTTEPFLAVDNSPKPPPTRISLSYAAIKDAKKVWVLVSGTGKEAAFRESLSPLGRTPLANVIRSRPVKIFSDLPEINL